MYIRNRFIPALTLFLVFLLHSFSLLGQVPVKKDKDKPLLYMDGKVINDADMANLNPNDIATVTILKAKSAAKYGEKGKNGVVLIETVAYRRKHFQEYFSSKSAAYSKILLGDKSADGIKYIMDGKVLNKKDETDLANITDSTFISIALIDAGDLLKSYAVSGSQWGVVIKTKAGPATEAIQAAIKTAKPAPLINELPKSKYDPQLLILAPAVTTFDASAAKEIDKIDQQLKGMATGQDSGVSVGESTRLMRQSAIDFSKNLNFFNQATMYAQSYLIYRFFEHFPNTLILVKDLKVKADLGSMAAVAKEQQMPYVMNFSVMHLAKERGGFVLHAQVELYEAESNSFLLDQEYTGDQLNQGFEFSCDGSISCTINNVLAKALPDVISKIAENNKTLQGEARLATARAANIAENIFPKAVDATLIRSTIPVRDSTVHIGDLYQAVYNADKSKFVGFFYRRESKKSLKSLSNNGDMNVKIISGKDMKDKNFLDIPQNNAYVVAGVLDKGTWYYSKDKVTYFEAENEKDAKLEYLNNLQQWGYFAANTSDASPDFWETGFFEKITDKRKSPDWEKYKDMWAFEERENRDYIGCYTIVADRLKKEKEIAASNYRDSIGRNVLKPFLDKLKKSKTDPISGYDEKMKYLLLIYGKNKQVILNPMEVNDSKGVLKVRYFVLFPGSAERYEWTYFPPFVKSKDILKNQITDDLNTITAWDYSYSTLDDDNFWNTYVLLKENGKYRYLKRLD